jgi:hypothetical protein
LLDKLDVQHIVLEQSEPEDKSAPDYSKIDHAQFHHLADCQHLCVSIDGEDDVDSIGGPVNEVTEIEVVPSELSYLFGLTPYEVSNQ